MIFVIVTLCITGVMSTSNFATKLTTAKKSAADQIKILTDFWEVDKYPLFLKSCEMHKSSWEFMKIRFMQSRKNKNTYKNTQY